MTYAKETSVPVTKTRLDIEYILKNAGATEYIQGNSGNTQAIAWTLEGKKYRLTITIPDINSPEVLYTPTKIKRSPSAAKKYWEQLERSMWRQLYIIIKAKLVAVESGIRTMEQEFREDMLLPNGQTVGEYIGPQIEQAYLTGNTPPLLPMI
jgi:hypothetical protein